MIRAQNKKKRVYWYEFSYIKSTNNKENVFYFEKDLQAGLPSFPLTYLILTKCKVPYNFLILCIRRPIGLERTFYNPWLCSKNVVGLTSCHKKYIRREICSYPNNFFKAQIHAQICFHSPEVGGVWVSTRVM